MNDGIAVIRGDKVETFNNISDVCDKLGLDEIDVSEALLNRYTINGYEFVWLGFI